MFQITPAEGGTTQTASAVIPDGLLDSIEVGIAVIDKNFSVEIWNKFLNHF